MQVINLVESSSNVAYNSDDNTQFSTADYLEPGTFLSDGSEPPSDGSQSVGDGCEVFGDHDSQLMESIVSFVKLIYPTKLCTTGFSYRL